MHAKPNAEFEIWHTRLVLWRQAAKKLSGLICLDPPKFLKIECCSCSTVNWYGSPLSLINQYSILIRLWKMTQRTSITLIPLARRHSSAHVQITLMTSFDIFQPCTSVIVYTFPLYCSIQQLLSLQANWLWAITLQYQLTTDCRMFRPRRSLSTAYKSVHSWQRPTWPKHPASVVNGTYS